jgi:hypothetical protein
MSCAVPCPSVNGTAARSVAEIKTMLERQQIVRAHSFDLAYAQHVIDLRLTRPNHLWANG